MEGLLTADEMQHGAASAVRAGGGGAQVQQQHDGPQLVAALSLAGRGQVHRRIRADILQIEQQ